MGIIPSRNLEEQRREENGVTYFDRGVIEGKDGRKYSRYAIQTHFVKVGEDQAALVEKYVRPLYQPGDVLSFGAKVMCMCCLLYTSSCGRAVEVSICRLPMPVYSQYSQRGFRAVSV